MIRMHSLARSHAAGESRLWVLRQIELQIHAGEFVSFMGPSGAGKSTLLNVMGLLDPGFEGEYWLDGIAVHKCSARERQDLQRRHVGFVFQHYHLLDDLTVHENLDVPLSYRNLPAAQRRARIEAMLERFGLGAHRALFPRQLSGGQQQMVAVARAVIAQPGLLLADEPTGALHSEQGSEIMRLFRELNQEGMTIVQVTHNPDYAQAGNRRIELRDGWMSEVAA